MVSILYLSVRFGEFIVDVIGAYLIVVHSTVLIKD